MNMVNASTSELFCVNAFSNRALITADETSALNGMFISLIPVTVIANGLVIYRIKRLKLHRSSSNILILAMHIADFLIGAVALPCVYALYSKHATARFCTFELSTQFISTTLVFISDITIMLIAVDRLLRHKSTSVHRMGISNRSAKILVFAAILVATLLSGTLAISSLFNSIRYITLALSIIILLIIATVFVSYIYTYMHISKFVRNSIVWNSSVCTTATGVITRQRAPEYLKKLGKTVLIIILGICVCHLPFVVLITIYFFSCQKKCEVNDQWLIFAIYISYAMVYSNSFLNAIIILFRNRNRCRYVIRNNPNAIAPENAR